MATSLQQMKNLNSNGISIKMSQIVEFKQTQIITFMKKKL